MIYKMSYNLSKIKGNTSYRVFVYLESLNRNEEVKFVYNSETKNLEFTITNKEEAFIVINTFIYDAGLIPYEANFDVLKFYNDSM